MLEVRLLGQFDVRLNGTLVIIPSRPAQSLLAYLILNAGTAYRREQLAGLLWPDTSDENARSNLRHALWRIRKAIEPHQTYLVADDLTIQFNPASPYWLDVKAINRVAEQDADPAKLIDALAQYRGDLLPGFYDEWITLERERLQAIFERKLELLLDRLSAAQRWPEVLEWSERWIALGQSPEPAYRSMMLAHSAMGNMAKVAATFDRCVQALHADLNVEPSEQTRRLYERLKTQPAALETGSTGQAKEMHQEFPKTNLPVPLTSFIGREKEVEDIVKLLGKNRLVTLTGAGGLGKTRLAIQSAHELSKLYPDGVWWVGLAAITEPARVPQAVAKTLGVREIQNQLLMETLAKHLGAKQMLVVLDNCEHLVNVCAQLADQLLNACTGLKILATSREPLGITGESILRVPSLSFPTLAHLSQFQNLNEFESIQLFIERAAAVRSDLPLTPENAFAVAQICHRLDGIPLAIELAAARTRVMALGEIASRLDDRFNLLTQGSRTALPRHQTLRAAIDWSYDLLNEQERVLFRRLSIFIGGFDLEAVEAICSDEQLEKSRLLNLAGQLVDKSLIDIRMQASAQYQSTRYRQLETIRQYGLEKLTELNETAAIRDRHLSYYIDLAEKSEPNIYGSESVLWRTRLGLDFENFRAALDWAATCGQAAAILRITGSLVYFWFSHGSLAEWHQRVEEALLTPEGMKRTSIRAKALNGIGFMDWVDIDTADRRPLIEEALAIGEELDDKWNMATALLNLGIFENEHGDQAEARQHLEQSLEIWGKIGAAAKLEIGRTLPFLGDVALIQGDEEQARSLYEEARVILQELGDKNVLGYALRRLGQLAGRANDHEKAKSLYKDSMQLNYETDDPRAVIACIASFADMAVALGKNDRAVRLMAAVESLLDSMNLRLVRIDQMEYDHHLSILRSQMDGVAFASAWAEGGVITLDQAIELVSVG